MHLTRIIFTAILLQFANIGSAYACECQWQGPFSWLVDDADIVALVSMGGGKGNSRDAQIDDLLKGKEFEPHIRIWGDYKNECRAQLHQFGVGTRLLVALHRIDEVPVGGFNPSTPNMSYGRVGDYALSRCGAYWLSEKNGQLTGNITSVFEWDYDPDMDPVPYYVMADFVAGKASYKDIIEHSAEVTSPEAMLRRSKRAIGRPRDWE